MLYQLELIVQMGFMFCLPDGYFKTSFFSEGCLIFNISCRLENEVSFFYTRAFMKSIFTEFYSTVLI